MSFKAPEKFRTKHGKLATGEAAGNNGAFVFDNGGTRLYCIASDQMGFDHVSVHAIRNGKVYTPSWAQMCWIKDQFWGEEDCVVQYHPAKAAYVNMHKHTLHLWRPTRQTLPVPNPLMVGIPEAKTSGHSQ